jgi:predicted O-methyltransferase YrrM
MDKIASKLLDLVEQTSDINQHLFTLKGYADGCEHITEMGVRGVVSTWALLAARPKTLIAIDIENCPIEEIREAAKEVGINFKFIKDDTIRESFEIEETDFLFIDTWHVYPQLKKELSMHSSKVKKYIAFHDTQTYGFVNERAFYSQPQGLQPAIKEFLQDNPEWVVSSNYKHNNGVIVIKRTNENL